MSLLLLDSVPNVGIFPPEVGRLHIDGEHFYTENGELWQWRGFSCFLLFLRFCRGEDITPDLRWFRAQGVNIVRVFGPLPWKETPDYRYEHFNWDKLPEFFRLLETWGLRCNWSLFHYVPDIDYPNAYLQSFAQAWFDIAQDFPLVVAEGVNEPHVGTKPDPIDALRGVDRHGVLTSYGYYKEAMDGQPGWPPTLDFGTGHWPRTDAWARKARISQEAQHGTGKPWISDEPAKITEPGFQYPGGKNDPLTTPHEAVWHAAICQLWTAGFTLHTEEGKWGRAPQPGMLQQTVADAVRDQVWLKINPLWQMGDYSGSHMGNSPVDDADTPDGDPIWTYSSAHDHKALSVRCYLSEPQAINGWRSVERWGPSYSIVRLER